jgi:hypothetical protein
MTILMENEIETSHLCLDCLKDTTAEQGDYYSLSDVLWQAITTPQERRGMLCVPCASERLGRPFTDDDFSVSPVEMVARLLAFRLARMTDEQKRRVVETYEDNAGEFDDIRPELSTFIKRLFTDH